MPTFCRHGRLEATCPICSRKASTPGRPAGPRRPGPPPRTSSGSASARIAARRRASRAGGDVVVRRLAGFGADDGFAHELVPGLRSSQDARRLAEELAFAAARLRELEADPPGLYAAVASAADPEDAVWLAFLIAYLSPLEGDDPWAAIELARTAPRMSLPELDAELALGPRAAHDPAHGDRTVRAWRAFVQARGGGSQLAALRGDPAWEAPRRFERTFERLAVPGLHRAARYELLVLLGRLGVVDARPGSLELAAAAPDDPVLVSAKRIFGLGDLAGITRRARALAQAAGVPIAAYDLGLHNFARPEGRITAGARIGQDAEGAARIAAVLGL